MEVVAKTPGRLLKPRFSNPVEVQAVGARLNLLEVESAMVFELLGALLGLGTSFCVGFPGSSAGGYLTRFSLALWSHPPRPGFATFLCRLWLSPIYMGYLASTQGSTRTACVYLALTSKLVREGIDRNLAQ